MPHFLPPDIISGTQEAHSGSSANSAGSTIFSVSLFTEEQKFFHVRPDEGRRAKQHQI
jgi:hypothetical protein